MDRDQKTDIVPEAKPIPIHVPRERFFLRPEKFWFVWNPNDKNPKRPHSTREYALAEAERLAVKHTGEPFVVLRAEQMRKKIGSAFEMQKLSFTKTAFTKNQKEEMAA